MSQVIFGSSFSFITAGTPSTGWVIGFDLDGVLKQKNSLGQIISIGGGPTAGNLGTASLADVLGINNNSQTRSIIMGTATNIKSSNGGSSAGQINLDYLGLTASILISNDSGSGNKSKLLITDSTVELVNNNTSGTVSVKSDKLNITTGSPASFPSGKRIFINSADSDGAVYIGASSIDNIKISATQGSSNITTNSQKEGVIISSQNSYFYESVRNSVILGGEDIIATQNDAVYTPNIIVKVGNYITTEGGNSYIEVNTDELYTYNSHSQIVVGSSTSSFSKNGIIVVDTYNTSNSPNLNGGVIYISTRNSDSLDFLTNVVVIGGQNLSATQSDTVYLGNNVNINNAYTLPSTDGTSGYVLKTDGLGNVSWQSDSGSTSDPLDQVLSIGNNSGAYSIIMGTGTSIKSSNGGGQLDLDFSSTINTVLLSTDNGGVSTAYIQLQDNDITIDSSSLFLITTLTNLIQVGDGKGLQYDGDYSATFVTYSLVDKNYVDSSLPTTTNGTDFITTNVIGLGGTLSQTTFIDGNSQNFLLTGSNQIEFGVSGSSTVKLRKVNGIYDSYIDVDAQAGYGISLSTQVSGSTYSYLSVEDTKLRFLTVDGVSLYQMSFEINNIPQVVGDGSSDNTMIVKDGYQKGLVYDGDYTSNFTTYSLVSKGYVDSSLPTPGNGLDYFTPGVIGLGGTISQNTLINGQNYELRFDSLDRLMVTVSTYIDLFQNSTDYDSEIYIGDNQALIQTRTSDVATFSRLIMTSEEVGLSSIVNSGLDGSNIRLLSYDYLIGDGSTNNRLIIDDSINQKGFVYDGDYTSNFTTYSLVTKGYVDANTSNKYVTTQSFTASVVETINHSLGTDEILVQCYNSSGEMVIPGTIQINGPNDVDITFSIDITNIKIIVIG